jgi:hypothetical protein
MNSHPRQPILKCILLIVLAIASVPFGLLVVRYQVLGNPSLGQEISAVLVSIAAGECLAIWSLIQAIRMPRTERFRAAMIVISAGSAVAPFFLARWLFG